MKHYILILATIITFLLPVQSWGGNFQKGVDAYAKGDYKTAMKEFKPLAEQGYKWAQHHLALMYYKGTGVPQDYKEAVKWYTLAAEQGIDEAQYNLGVMYTLGQGVIQDSVYAHMWANIASSNGLEKARETRDIIAERMTPSQIEEAQKLARKCVAKKYKGC